MSKFVVQMPIKKEPECLGESKNIALQKFNYHYKGQKRTLSKCLFMLNL